MKVFRRRYILPLECQDEMIPSLAGMKRVTYRDTPVFVSNPSEVRKMLQELPIGRRFLIGGTLKSLLQK